MFLARTSRVSVSIELFDLVFDVPKLEEAFVFCSFDKEL